MLLLNQEKTMKFGAAGHSDFTIHRDEAKNNDI